MDKTLLARWICDILLGELRYRKRDISRVNLTTFTVFMALIDRGIISEHDGKRMLRALLDQKTI